jgi:hypothetical protein
MNKSLSVSSQLKLETAPLSQDRFFMKLDSFGKAKQAQRVPGG